MLKRICPICDHVIKRGHYCSFCKQWIRNPNTVNATYYLNERHPENEVRCEYHGLSPEMEAASGRQRLAEKAAAKKKGPVYRPKSQKSSSAYFGGKQKSPAASAIITFVVIMFVLVFLFNLIPFFMFMFW